ncbi:MAG: hypothetical protein IKA36_00835, partial [Clostridia bacterium]|nr:hypothetical protein [Clostridia bacterium]
VEYSISCAPDPKYVAVPTNLFDTEDQVIEPVREEDVDPLEESNEPEINLSDAMLADEKSVDNCPIESAIPELEYDSSLAETTIATNEEEVNDKLESVGQPEYEIRNEEDTKVEPVASSAPSIKPVNQNNNNHNHNQYHRGGNGKNRNKK